MYNNLRVVLFCSIEDLNIQHDKFKYVIQDLYTKITTILCFQVFRDTSYLYCYTVSTQPSPRHNDYDLPYIRYNPNIRNAICSVLICIYLYTYAYVYTNR